MAKVYPINYGRATLWHRLVGDPEDMAVTFDFHDESAGSLSADNIAALIYAAWVGTGKMFVPANVSNTLSAVKVDVMIVREAVVPVKVGQYNLVTSGTRSSSPLPSNCSFFARKVTGNAGRKYKGRFYWPGGYLVAASVSAVGSITASPDLATLQTALTNFYNALDSNELIPQIIHGDDGETPPTPVTGFVAQQIIATQRRRLRP